MSNAMTTINFPTTECSLFIIEALPDEDVKTARLDGSVLNQQLNLTLKKPMYRFAKNKEEFKSSLSEFKRSGCRFLHISCHGSASGGVFQLGCDKVNYAEFATYFKGNVHNIRLTFSACYAGKGLLFREIVKQCGTSVHSILGFRTKVDFDLASAFWISYYTVVTRLTNYRKGKNCDHIQSGGLAKIIEDIGVLYRLKLRFCYPHLVRKEWYCCDEEFTPVLTHWRNQQNFKIICRCGKNLLAQRYVISREKGTMR